ncbi:NAD-dependent epimerase/dehydratase family protein [Niabella hirudinis]|uniref:NAD-dependent epimerase/dehydratase family protein n=1 Tax=Niabella hirudinis TaxID=1285929 RepID=UPI003EB6BD30
MSESLLFTGATGFLGNNIKALLEKSYTITTMGSSAMNHYQVDIAKQIPNLDKPYDIILHAAGKAHSIPKTDAERNAFFDVNLQGTKNLCAAFEKSGYPHAFIFISTVAVYGCEKGENISEDHPLNGAEPYALSKKKTEAFLLDWCNRHNIVLSILRPALIAGSNAPGNLGAMVNGIKTGKYVSIAGSKARKSVLMGRDIADLVPLLTKKGGIYNVCDNSHPTVKELEILIARQLNRPPPKNVPYWVAKAIALAGDILNNKIPINTKKLKKITETLTFSNQKAKKELHWQPSDVMQNYRI